MTPEEKKHELSRHRLQQAQESLEEAAFLLTGRKSARSVINRAYYAMFYAVPALLVYEPATTSKHSGILTYFNRQFVKEGILPKELGRSINTAFELRQRGDYREYVNLTYEQVEPYIGEARTFIDEVRSHLESHWNAEQ